jgi:hypothetical protein
MPNVFFAFVGVFTNKAYSKYKEAESDKWSSTLIKSMLAKTPTLAEIVK